MIHLLPACGKLSAGIAVLMQDLGLDITCYDNNPSYPMLEILEKAKISVSTTLPPWESISKDDDIVIGNSLSRGHPWVEGALRDGKTLMSMPQWLHEHVLCKRKVIAIAGTHGKTSVSAMLSWLLQELGEDVGYLIGGIADGLPSSAHLGDSKWFVIEADEYDTVWFDKRAKLFWYWPEIAVLNHVEYDHPDIYMNEEIMMQAYRHWLRMLPPEGVACISKRVDELDLLHPLGGKKCIVDEDVSVTHHSLKSWTYDIQGEEYLNYEGLLEGHYHAENVWLTVKVAAQLGFDLKEALICMQKFSGVKKRMVWVKTCRGAEVYDDFAHHPTALKAICQSFEASKIHLVIYPSNALWRSKYASDLMDWSMAKHIYMLDHPRLPDEMREMYQKVAIWHDSPQAAAGDISHKMMPGDVVITCSSDDMRLIHDALL